MEGFCGQRDSQICLTDVIFQNSKVLFTEVPNIKGQLQRCRSIVIQTVERHLCDIAYNTLPRK